MSIPYRHDKENAILAVGFSGCDRATIVRETENPLLAARFLWAKALCSNPEDLIELLKVCSVHLDTEKLSLVVKTIFKRKLASEAIEVCEEALGEEAFVEIAFVFGLISAAKKGETAYEAKVDRQQ